VVAEAVVQVGQAVVLVVIENQMVELLAVIQPLL
jgi:hypothetical protein